MPYDLPHMSLWQIAGLLLACILMLLAAIAPGARQREQDPPANPPESGGRENPSYQAAMRAPVSIRTRAGAVKPIAAPAFMCLGPDACGDQAACTAAGDCMRIAPRRRQVTDRAKVLDAIARAEHDTAAAMAPPAPIEFTLRPLEDRAMQQAVHATMGDGYDYRPARDAASSLHSDPV